MSLRLGPAGRCSRQAGPSLRASQESSVEASTCGEAPSSVRDMEIAGLPLHPLVVHAAVVLIPLTALLAVAFAVLPRWRWLVRWPTARRLGRVRRVRVPGDHLGGVAGGGAQPRAAGRTSTPSAASCWPTSPSCWPSWWWSPPWCCPGPRGWRAAGARWCAGSSTPTRCWPCCWWPSPRRGAGAGGARPATPAPGAVWPAERRPAQSVGRPRGWRAAAGTTPRAPPPCGRRRPPRRARTPARPRRGCSRAGSRR